MRKNRFTEEQSIGILHELDSGAKIAEVRRRHGVAHATIHRWRRKYGGLQVSEARRHESLENENCQLKRIVGDQAIRLCIIAAKIAFTPGLRRPRLSHLRQPAGALSLSISPPLGRSTTGHY